MIRHRLLTLGALGLAVLLLIGIATVWLAQQSRQDQQWVAHSLELEARMTQLQFMVRSVEGSQRSYLLTGDKEYLETFDASLAAIPPLAAEIGDRTADNPAQQRAMAQLRPLLDRVPNFRNAIAMADGGDCAGAMALVRTNRGRELGEQVDTVLRGMKAEEERLLAERTAASRSTQLWLVAITIIGLLAIAAVAVVAVLMVRRSNATMLAMQGELAVANEGLEAMVAERTAELQEANDEIQRFAYIVSHDLRSPLVNIMGFTSELEASARMPSFERVGRPARPAVPDESAAGRRGAAGGFRGGHRLHQDLDRQDGPADQRHPEAVARRAGASSRPSRST